MAAYGHLNCDADLKFQLAEQFFSMRRIEDAINAFDEAQSLGFDPDRCGAWRWQCRMLLGDFKNAWRESDEISRRGARSPNALWDGLPFTGKRVVIRCLHGYGDAIQFLRYARLVREQAARVIVETHPEMVSLLERIPFIDDVSTWADGSSPRREDWDQQIEVTELPWAFRTTTATIPADIPYLKIPPAAQLRSARSLKYSERGSSGRKKRTGLLWASSTWNPARSMPLAALRPLVGVACCAFYSFQRGPERAQLVDSDEFGGIHDTSVHSPEIADTAADLLNMDLLITVDTMAAHLAGALGKPVWTMLPFEADWRWMLERCDTPWYPTMRLFRQPVPGDWEAVVAAVKTELERFAGKV